MNSLLAALALSASPPTLLSVKTVVPDVVADLRYATTNNFVKKQLYPSNAFCLLLEPAAAKLKVAADALRAEGYVLHVYDCYRPLRVQWELWKVMPKPGYVADPRKGSNHNRGCAVDLTLEKIGAPGEVEMPSAYDFFGPAAHHSFTQASPAALENRARLRTAMEAAGFKKNAMEWWHYELPDAPRYPLRNDDLVPEHTGPAQASPPPQEGTKKIGPHGQ